MKFVAEEDQLIIQLEGAEKFWSIINKLAIPREKIVDLQWQTNYVAPRLWRLAGTDLPGSLWAGRFYGDGQKYFLYVHNPRGITWFRRPSELQNILHLTVQDYQFQHIIITCQPDIGASLLNWWQAG